jgi:anti-anti-sigma regulatory factor
MPDAPKQIRVSDANGVAVVCFNDLWRCASDDGAALQLGEELLAVADQKQWTSVILDFEGREFVPAAIVEAPLVRLHKRLGRNLRMCNVPPMAMEQFQINRLALLFHIYRTREEALESASAPGD